MLDNRSGLINRQVHVIERLVSLFYERLETGGAVIALITFTIFAALAGFILAVLTRHCEPCLSLAIGSQSSCLG
jgi:hypothetical protein